MLLYCGPNEELKCSSTGGGIARVIQITLLQSKSGTRKRLT